MYTQKHTYREICAQMYKHAHIVSDIQYAQTEMQVLKHKCMHTRHTDYRDINRHKETQTHTNPCVRTNVLAHAHTCTFPKLPFKVEGTVVPGPQLLSGSFHTSSKLGEA